jgi:signal transduction histidine kinase
MTTAHVSGSDRRTLAVAATALLARLQTITAALSTTVTQDAVAETVIRETIVALECDAGAVVVTGEESGAEVGHLALLRESGALDALLRSYLPATSPDARTPYADALDTCAPVYLASCDEMLARYPAYRQLATDGAYEAWIFLPLEVGGDAFGVLAFGFARSRTFSLLDRQFADTVSRYCAQALDRARHRIAAAAALAEASEARMMAEHANNAKTLFLRAMSHDLRTPLNAITGYTELLELGLRGPVNAEQIQDLGRIKRASAFLLRLINDILTVARLDGARPLRLAPVAVQPVLDEVEALCALQARAKGLGLKVAQSDRVILVTADAERLQQILLNLFTNAIQFTAKGGCVDVACHVDEATVRVCVNDTGVGVRLLDVERVFEPFVQIDRHLTKVAPEGAGLGLSIGRELARAMHGDLTLESIEGEGSTFTLVLPLAQPADDGVTILPVDTTLCPSEETATAQKRRGRDAVRSPGDVPAPAAA